MIKALKIKYVRIISLRQIARLRCRMEDLARDCSAVKMLLPQSSPAYDTADKLEGHLDLLLEQLDLWDINAAPEAGRVAE